MKESSSKIISVTGYSGSGKSVFAEVLRTELNTDMVNVGNVMRSVAHADGFGTLTEFIMANGVACSFRISREHVIKNIMQIYPKRNVIMDGLYDPELAETIIKISGNYSSLIVNVHANESIRHKRIASRNGVNALSGKAEAEMRDRIKELAGIKSVIKMASFTVDNNGSLWELKGTAHKFGLMVLNEA